MSVLNADAMAKYVDVLAQRAQQAQLAAVRAQQALERSRQQVQMLKNLVQSAELKKSVGNVALHANAAGFRSGVLEMAAQRSDACNVQALEWQQAQQSMQGAMRQHASMQEVLTQAQHQTAQVRERQTQKTMDEMAVQAWLRRKQATAEAAETVRRSSSEACNEH